MIVISQYLVSEADCYLEFDSVYGVPETDLHVSERVRDFDETVIFFV